MYSLGYASGWEVPFGSFFCIGQPFSVYCGGLGSLFLFNILRREDIVMWRGSSAHETNGLCLHTLLVLGGSFLFEFNVLLSWQGARVGKKHKKVWRRVAPLCLFWSQGGL